MSLAYEKGDAYDSSNIERVTTSSASDLDVDEIYSHAEQRAIIHRVDRRLVTMCGVMYCISLMDRTNLSAAAIAGYVRLSRDTLSFR